MKKILYFLLFAFIATTTQARVITSTSTGGNWGSTGTWGTGIVPGSTDTAIIATSSGSSVTVNVTETVLNVTVNSSATLTISSTLNVNGLLTNNGSVGGSGTLYFKASSGTVLSGGGGWSSNTGTIEFEGTNQTIDASVSLSKSTGGITLNTTALGGAIKVTNNGSITLSDVNLGHILNSGSTYSTVWINAASSYLSVAAASFTNTKDTLYASATGNTVAFGSSSTIILKNPKNNTFYNLVIAGTGIQSMPNNYTAYSVTVNSGAELNMSGDSLFLTSGLTNSGTVIDHQSTFPVDTAVVKVGGSITQKIPPTGLKITSISTATLWNSSSAWVNGLVPGPLDTAVIANTSGYTMSASNNYAYKVIVNSGATLNFDLTIRGILINNGTIASSTTFIFTLNSGTVLSGGGSWAGGSLTLEFQGTSQIIDASANNVQVGNIKLNTTSLGGPVKVRNKGSVTIYENSAGAVTNQGTTYSSVWINDTNAYLKVLNASFTNSKDTLYANAPGNTIEYGGNSVYTMKTPKTTYYNLTTSDTNTAKLPAALTVSNNLKISVGTLDVTTSNYGLTIGGNFTDNGTFTQRSGTVTFNGSANQQLNGSNTPTFYNLTENQAAANDSLFLNAGLTVSNTLTTTQGILDCQKHQLTNSATPVVSLSPSSATICNGSSTSLSASSYTGYVWFPSTGLSATTGSSITASPSATTTYTVYGNNSHTYTCGSGTDAITVNATPTVTPSSADVCLGSSASLTASGASTYSWSPSSGLSATTGATVTATPTATTTYSVTGTDGCSQTITVTTHTVTTSCSSPIHLRSGDLDTDFAFQPCETTLWFSFVADSARMLLDIMRPKLSGDTAFAHIDSLALYSGSCGSLSLLAVDVNNHVNFKDSLPVLQPLNLTVGQTYFFKVTRVLNNWTNYPYYFGLYRRYYKAPLIPTPCVSSNCIISTTNYICNGDFETAPSWASTLLSPVTQTTYYDEDGGHSLSSGYCIGSGEMWYLTTGLSGQPSALPCNLSGQDYTDMYNIGTYMGPNYNNTAESGSFFMGVTCPSDDCDQCTVDCTGLGTLITPGYLCIPYNINSLPIPAGGTFLFTCWIEDLNTNTTLPGAGVTLYMGGNGLTFPIGKYFYDVIGANYSTWTPISFCFTSGSIGGIAAFQFQASGGPSPNGFDFAIDNVSIYQVNTNTISVSPSSVSICTGAATTLTASGGASGTEYTWSPSTGLSATTGATVTASPTVTTVYTVSNCNSSATVTVTVNPLPTISVSASGLTSFCAGGSVGLTASGAGAGGTYTWAPSIGLSATTGANVTASPTSPVTYTVTGTNSNGCSNTSTIYVDANPFCCYTGSAVYSWNNQTIPTSSYSTSGVIVISGTCTVSSAVTFSGCPDVQMAANAEIIVAPGGSLTIENSGSTISRLYACGNMWNGITVDPDATSPGQLYISGGSIVEDAKIAISIPTTSGSNNPTVSVINSKLNNDYEGVNIDGYTGSGAYPNLTLQNVTFTSGTTDAPYSPGPYLKGPTYTGITFAGIYMKDVQGGGIQIGDPSSLSYTNNFSYMNYGIVGISSNFTVYNNSFSYLEGYAPRSCAGPCPYVKPIGIGVVAWATPFSPTNGSEYYSVTVGGGSLYQSNTFTDCYIGVDDINYVSTSVTNNNFGGGNNSGITGNPKIGNTAINAQIEYATTMELNNNIITNYLDGIHLLRTRKSTQDMSIYPEDINYNQINVSGGIMQTGIMAENSTFGNFAPINIENNAPVYDGVNGIWVRNFGDQPCTIEENTIRALQSPPSARTAERTGIRVEHCSDKTSVISNNVFTISAYTGTITVTPADTDVVGINCLSSQQDLVQCNNVYDIGECYRFTDYCNSTQFVSNNIAYPSGNCYDGFVLWNNAIIGPQGNSSNPIGDYWGAASNFLRSMTYTYYPATYTHTNLPTASPLYLQTSSLPYFPTASPNPNLSNLSPAATYSYQAPTALNNVGGSGPSCGTPCICHTHDSTHVMDSVVMDSINYSVDSAQSYYVNRQMVYASIAQDTGYMTGDTTLRKFYNTTTTQNIGKIFTVENYIASGDMGGSILTLDNAIVPANQIEKNHKTLDSLILVVEQAGVDTLDSAQAVKMYNIASQCRELGGLAVYSARSAYNWLMQTDIQFTDSCGSGGDHKAIRRGGDNNNQVTRVTNNLATVYPNPASTLLNVQLQLPPGKVYEICMYNSLGEKVVCEELAQNLTTLPINNLAMGIYYYRITDESNNLIKADKLMIIR